MDFEDLGTTAVHLAKIDSNVKKIWNIYEQSSEPTVGQNLCGTEDTVPVLGQVGDLSTILTWYSFQGLFPTYWFSFKTHLNGRWCRLDKDIVVTGKLGKSILFWVFILFWFFLS